MEIFFLIMYSIYVLIRWRNLEVSWRFVLLIPPVRWIRLLHVIFTFTQMMIFFLHSVYPFLICLFPTSVVGCCWSSSVDFLHHFLTSTWHWLLQVDYWCSVYTYSDGTHITVTLTVMWGCTYFWPHPKGMTSHSPPAWDCGSLLVVRGIVWLYIRVYVNTYEYNHDHHFLV